MNVDIKLSQSPSSSVMLLVGCCIPGEYIVVYTLGL